MNIIAQIIGFLALSTWIISIQSKNKKTVVILQAIANLLYGIQYYLLNAFVATIMNTISFLRNLVFYYDEKKDNKTSIYSLLFFLLSITILAVLTVRDYLSLIPIIITFSYSIAIWQKSMKFNRIVYVSAAVLWTYYNYNVGAYVPFIGNMFEIISGTIALIRFRNKK